MAYLTAASAKARDPRLNAYTDAEVVAGVASFEAIAEEYRGVAYEPRTQTDYFDRTTSLTLLLRRVRVRSITSITSDGVAVAATAYTLSRQGIVTSKTSWTGDEIAVTYSHGYSTPVLALVLDACTEYVYSLTQSRNSGTSRNVLSQSSDGGTTRYSTPNWAAGQPTGYLEVDRLLNSLTNERMGFA